MPLAIAALAVGLLTFTFPHSGNLAMAALAVGGLICGFYPPPTDRPPRPLGKLFYAVLALVAAWLVAIVTSRDPRLSLELSLGLIPGLLVLALTVTALHDRRHLLALYGGLTLMSLSLSLQALGAFATAPHLHPLEWVERLAIPLLVVPNDFILLSLLAPFSAALLYYRPRGWVGWVVASGVVASLALGVAVTVVYQSGIALMAFGIALLPMALGWRWRTTLAAAGVGMLVVALVDAGLGWPLLLKYMKFINQLDFRLALWAAAWQMFLADPWLGQGIHTFGSIYLAFLQQVELPSWLATDSRHTPWAHNLFLETLAEQGSVGFCVLIIFIFLLFSSCWNTLHQLTTRLKGLILAPMCGGLGFCFSGTFELSFKRLWVILVVFLLSGIIIALYRASETLSED
ncbi:MAG: O-antigen ligase family protein [Candidatus Competibacterales bacterium]